MAEKEQQSSSSQEQGSSAYDEDRKALLVLAFMPKLEIATLDQEVNISQQTLGTAIQDIGIRLANDAIPHNDIETGVTGISNNNDSGDHQHPLNVNAESPKRDNSAGAAGTSTAYLRADHQHLLNTDPTVANKPVKDT
ncbi:MAG: hypothetical protein EZS28_014890 [Streblomastix strix]|uniref:Uncharacterized protein n=1 Tax=Streblomastix strix TaxID=222440 RepID=A0A5J4W3M6_9EUKA|nr:MAG: hypothetical protein EZS28_014890 [Streblomastix strix]